MTNVRPTSWVEAAAEETVSEVVYMGNAKDRKRRKDEDVRRNAAIIAKYYAGTQECVCGRPVTACIGETPKCPQQQSAEEIAARIYEATPLNQVATTTVFRGNVVATIAAEIWPLVRSLSTLNDMRARWNELVEERDDLKERLRVVTKEKNRAFDTLHWARIHEPWEVELGPPITEKLDK